MELIAQMSPSVKARIAAIFYVAVFLTGVPALRSASLIRPGDAAATAANILAHETLFRVGAVANLIATACYLVVTALFYELFKPASRSASLTAACFSLTGCAIGAVSTTFYIAPLIILKASTPLAPALLRALSMLSLNVASHCYNSALVFFGVYCFLIGCLALRSTFLPHILGILMIVAGCGWLTFLWPPLAQSMNPYILLPGIIGEASLTVWLLVMGVNVPRWNEQAIHA